MQMVNKLWDRKNSMGYVLGKKPKKTKRLKPDLKIKVA